MPLNRYLIRNEYNLADRQVYKAARRDDPEALLEGVTMAGLVGVLRQLGDLAEFAAEIFHGLHEEVMATAARRHDLIVRVQQLEAELPSVEKALLTQTSHTAAFCNPGVDWHSKVHIDENVVTQRDLPRFVMDNYEDSRGPPRLFLLDKFDVAGAGACLKRYSDPSFFKIESADFSFTNAEAQREKKTRKAKRRGPRMRNGDTSEVISSSHANCSLHQLLSEDIGSGSADPERRIKLKKRPLDGFHCREKSGRSYMQKLFDVCSPEHKFVHEISLDLVLMDPVSDITPKSGLEIVEIDTTILSQKPSERDKETLSPSYVPDLVDKRSIDELIDVSNGKHAELSWENHGSESDKILLLLSKEINDEEELASDSGRKSGDEGESDSDDMSNGDSFVDALATMESEVETDTEPRTPRDLRHLNSSKTMVDSEGSDGQDDFNDPLSDFQSFGNSTVSDDESVLKQGIEKSLHSDKSTIGAIIPDGGEEAAEIFLEDLLAEQQSLSVVVGREETDDYVACTTSDLPDRKSRVTAKMEEASPKSGRIEDKFAKTEIKWVKRCDEVSSEETGTSSLFGAEDPHIPDQFSNPSQTDCTPDDSTASLFDHINEQSNSSVILLEEASLGCKSVAKNTHFSSHTQEKSQDPFLQDKISGTRDVGFSDQLDVSQVPLPCYGDVANISSVSKVEDSQKSEETEVSTWGEQTSDSRTFPLMDGQDIEENTRHVDHQNETQIPTPETICLPQVICLGETEAAGQQRGDPAEARVTGSDENISSTNGKSQSGSDVKDVKETLDAIRVEEAQSGFTNESTVNQKASPASYLDQSDSTLCETGDDKHPDDCVEAIEKLVYLVSVNDETKEEIPRRASSESPSEHFIASDYVFEEERFVDMNHTAVSKLCREVVVSRVPDDGIKDETVDIGPVSSSPLDHSLSLGPTNQHEEFSSSSHCGKGSPPSSPDCPAELEGQNDTSHVDNDPVNSGSISCATVSSDDLVSDTGSCVFLADNDHSNPYPSYLSEDKEDHIDASDNCDHSRSLVGAGKAAEPHDHKCSQEGSWQDLELGQTVPDNLSTQSTTLDSENPSETIPEIHQGMGPITSACPSKNVLPDQIKVGQKFDISMKPVDTSSGSPVLGVVSDTSQTKMDEAPPLPPLPPMQWRLGKNQQNASSMWPILGSGQQLATVQARDYDLKGHQHWDPFSSFPNGDSEVTNLSAQVKLINQEAAIQDQELQHISPTGQQEKVIPNKPFDHISDSIEQENVKFSSQSVLPLPMQHGVQLQHGFITPEDQQAWSRNAFFAVESGNGNENGNGNMQKKPPRPRNPLIEEVVALDKSKLRKVGERVRHQDEPRAENIRQNLPKLRKVGERTHPKDTPMSQQLQESLPQLRKVGEKLKSADEANFERREQNPAQTQEVAERVECHDEPQSEKRGYQDELKSEEKRSIFPRLQKIGERVNLQGGSSTDDRDSLMEQIRNKTFNLKPTMTTRASIQGPQTNLQIAAILEKATTIRQAMAGSDEDDSDGWSDN